MVCSWRDIRLIVLVGGRKSVGRWFFDHSILDRCRTTQSCCVGDYALSVDHFNQHLGVRFFGKIEFWFSVVKVCICLGPICMLLVIALGANKRQTRFPFLE